MDPNPFRLLVLIVAGGNGSRMDQGMPKQYAILAGIPVLRRSVSAFLACPDVAEIAVVIDPARQRDYENAVRGLAIASPIAGGNTRQQSVLNGLQANESKGFSHVLIHDAARPLVSPALVARVITALKEGHEAVLPVLSIEETIKRLSAGVVDKTEPRENLVAAQTPQGFVFATILALHRRFAGSPATDDAMLAEYGGIAVATVKGEKHNRKLTTPEDFMEAEMALQKTGGQMETRIGQGFDVHRFTAFGAEDKPSKRHISLCGVAVEHTQRLEGHSDADVGLHAVTDAILGGTGRRRYR